MRKLLECINALCGTRGAYTLGARILRHIRTCTRGLYRARTSVLCTRTNSVRVDLGCLYKPQTPSIEHRSILISYSKMWERKSFPTSKQIEN